MTGGASAKRKGTYAERVVQKYLEARGWVCVRAWSSIGPWDVLGLHPGLPPIMVQVKSGATGAYIRPAERAALLKMAHRAGARPVLAYYPRKGGRPIEWSQLVNMAEYGEWSPE